MTPMAMLVELSSQVKHSKSKEMLIIAMVTALSLLPSLVNTADLRKEKNKHSKAVVHTEATESKDPNLCWKFENFLTKTECLQCTNDEKTELPACKETGNKQLIQCEKSKAKTYISCPFVGSVEKKRFWAFEAISFAFAVLSNVAVWWRRRSLNHVHYQRVKRQMSDASV